MRTRDPQRKQHEILDGIAACTTALARFPGDLNSCARCASGRRAPAPWRPRSPRRSRAGRRPAALTRDPPHEPAAPRPRCRHHRRQGRPRTRQVRNACPGGCTWPAPVRSLQPDYIREGLCGSWKLCSITGDTLIRFPNKADGSARPGARGRGLARPRTGSRGGTPPEQRNFPVKTRKSSAPERTTKAERKMNRINTSTLDQWIARTRDATWAVSVERRNAHSLPGPYCKEITEPPRMLCCSTHSDTPSDAVLPVPEADALRLDGTHS